MAGYLWWDKFFYIFKYVVTLNKLKTIEDEFRDTEVGYMVSWFDSFHYTSITVFVVYLNVMCCSMLQVYQHIHLKFVGSGKVLYHYSWYFDRKHTPCSKLKIDHLNLDG